MAERITVETLKDWLNNPQVIIVDVRAPKDWEATAAKIKNARRREPVQVQDWAGELPREKKIVLYCA